MGITKRQIRVDEKGRKIPPKYRLLEIDGKLYIASMRGILDVVESSRKKFINNKQTNGRTAVN